MQSPSIGVIAAALSLVQSEVRSAQKSGDNKFDHYQYAKLEDFMAQAKPVLAKHGFALICSTDEVIPMEDRTTKNGGIEHCVRVKVTATLWHKSGEFITASGYGEGQDRADKAIYKAITGAKKYLVAGMLAIPTTDDPESDESVGLATKAAMQKVASKTGEVLKKKPEWTQAQKDEAGLLRKEIIDCLGDEGEAKVAELWKRMGYDKPDDVINELCKMRDEIGGAK